MSLVLNVWLDSTGITQTFFNWSITVKLYLPNNIVPKISVEYMYNSYALDVTTPDERGWGIFSPGLGVFSKARNLN